MSSYYENWVEEQDHAAEAEHEEWLLTPEGQAWRAERQKLRAVIEWSNLKHEKEEMAAERARLERERHWQTDNPVEWSAWKQLQVVLEKDLLPEFSGRPSYDFEAFLAEVRPAPPGVSRIVQKDEMVAFRPGNLKWEQERTPPAEPEYLSLQEVAQRSGFSYDFVYDAVRSGDLVAVQKGRQWKVKPADFRAWMDRGGAASTAPSRPELKASVSRHFPGKSR